jgi:Short C-terminal domain
MPGLIRGVARTAVVAGTATAVSNRVSRRQANRWANQAPAPQPAQAEYAPPPPPAAAGGEDDMLAQLEKLGQLKEAGVLTDEEFAQQKARILGA